MIGTNFRRRMETEQERAMLETRLGAFMRLLQPALVVAFLCAQGLFWLNRQFIPPAAGIIWLVAVSLLTVIWSFYLLTERRTAAFSGRSFIRRSVFFACLLVMFFGLAYLFLFMHLTGFNQLVLVTFMMILVFSGSMIAIPAPEIMIVWILGMNGSVYAAIILAGGEFMVASLIGHTAFVVFLYFNSMAFYRLYRDRFRYQTGAEEREKEISMLFDQSPLSIVMTDPDGCIVQANKKMEELSGYTQSELIGKNPRILRSRDTPSAVYADLWATITSGKTWTGEFINRNKQGEKYIERAVISPIMGPTGTIHRYMAIKEDITLQKGYERQMTRQSEIIELLLRDFEDQSSDWLWELDVSLHIVYVSDRIKKMWQYGSLYDVHIHDFFMKQLPVDDIEAEELLEKLTAALSVGLSFKDVQLKMTVAGELRWISLSAAPLSGADGSPSGWRGVGRNITDKKILELQLLRRANFDELTGLPNRHRFQELLDDYIDSALPGFTAVLGIMKMGKLDLIRAELGSPVCNSVIDVFIRKFREHFGGGVLFAKLARDEFALWALDPDPELIDKIHQFSRHINESVPVGSESFQVGLYVGLAFFPADATDRNGIFRAADLALNGALALANRKVMRYHVALATDFIHKLTLVKEFPGALEANQFLMYYQPQVSAKDGRITGAEALVRWQHPRDGLVTPGVFIPLAEQSGFILALGEWTLLQACRDAMEWDRSMTVSINVSGVQLRDPRTMVRIVKKVLSETSLPPERLVLEITESAMFGIEDDITELLAGLQSLGLSVALDDFGTGYSSLAYIQKLHLNKIKIDQSFVRRIGTDRYADSIIRIIQDLAENLDLETVAEGVETEAQSAALGALGCDTLQGYLFGKAMSQADFRALTGFPFS